MKEILKRRFKKSELKPRPGAGNLTSIDAYAVIDRLNEAFGETNWKVKVKETIWGDSEVIVFGCLSIYESGAWKDLSDTFGGMKQAFKRNGGEAIHLKSDLAKGATTSLIGKSASFLGIGIDVYQGKQTHESPDIQSPQPKYTALNDEQFTKNSNKIASKWGGDVKEVDGKKAIEIEGIHLLLSPDQFSQIEELKNIENEFKGKK